MKYFIHIVATIFFGWPALIAGYIGRVVSSCWIAGGFIAEMHEDAVIEKFVNRKEGKT